MNNSALMNHKEAEPMSSSDRDGNRNQPMPVATGRCFEAGEAKRIHLSIGATVDI